MSNLDIIREKLDAGKFTDLEELAEGLLCALESIESTCVKVKASEVNPGYQVVHIASLNSTIEFYTEEFATVPETCAHETYRATLETPAEGCEEDAVEGSEYCEEHSR